jgi:hypothetical protein
VAPLHQVPPVRAVGPGPLLPVAPVLGHNAGGCASSRQETRPPL